MCDRPRLANVSEASLYFRVGGDPFFIALVDRFYEGVATDDLLAPMYPEYPDFSGAKHRLAGFLIQYWGGPMTYSEERGHPRLRMRHFPYPIGPLEHDHWLLHMAAAVEQTCASDDVPAGIDDELMAYFVPVADGLRNDGIDRSAFVGST